jgi:hypothetical protein
MSEFYCERCYNTGELDCYCGGDSCVCTRYGTYPCPDCEKKRGIDEYDDADILQHRPHDQRGEQNAKS